MEKSMSIIFILVLLSSYTSSVLSADIDEPTLIKIKEQLGNPSALDIWEGTGFCHRPYTYPSYGPSTVCDSTGRVLSLVLAYIDTSATIPDAICDLTGLQNLTIERSPGIYGRMPCCFRDFSSLKSRRIDLTSISYPMNCRGKPPPYLAPPPPPYLASPPPPPPQYADVDEPTLMKIKEQLGNPSHLSSWVAGTSFCHFNSEVICNPAGRVTLLSLESFDATVPFPDAICDLTELQYLIINRVPGLYGPIPSCVNKLFNLYKLVITETSLSGPVPDFLNHTNIKTIILTTNQLSGPIPPSLLAIPSLDYLDLSSNYLTGTIPEPYHHAPAVLVLSNNNLTGEMPQCYGWIDFVRIELENNRLSGDASFLFGNQKKAFLIDLSNNEFEFDLSYVEFSTSLHYLNLSHNKIWGKVPDSAMVAKALWYLNVSYNKLCGEILQNGTWEYKVEDFVNNMCLCGNPLPQCLAPASAPAMAPL